MPVPVNTGMHMQGPSNFDKCKAEADKACGSGNT